MIYFCADDYGISHGCNRHIEECAEHGVLNKISVLPNGEWDALPKGVTLSLHLNLVEGHPLSNPRDIPLLTDENGTFRHSFIGLLWLSLTRPRALREQAYTELRRQLAFWREQMGDVPLSLDSHQHTHMIPLLFRTLLRAAKDEGVEVAFLRFPAEPIGVYLKTPILYTAYPLKGLVKQWLLATLGLFNRRPLKKSGMRTAYFLGVIFSGRVTADVISALLPRYQALHENADIEIALHPGFPEADEPLLDGAREGFKAFYYDPRRRAEYDTLLKEGLKNAVSRY